MSLAIENTPTTRKLWKNAIPTSLFSSIFFSSPYSHAIPLPFLKARHQKVNYCTGQIYLWESLYWKFPLFCTYSSWFWCVEIFCNWSVGFLFFKKIYLQEVCALRFSVGKGHATILIHFLVLSVTAMMAGTRFRLVLWPSPLA